MDFPTYVNAYDCDSNSFYPAKARLEEGALKLTRTAAHESDIYVTPGWIDAHAHVYCIGDDALGVDCDTIGIKQGVHLIMDAGTCGADNIDRLLEESKRWDTLLRAYLHINSRGIRRGVAEGTELELMDSVKTARAAERLSGFVLGIKVRVERPVTGEAGIKPLMPALEAARLCGMPLAVHIGAHPPWGVDVIKHLRRGDVVCHAFHAKGDEPWLADGSPAPELEQAIARGVQFDLAHGCTAFSYEIFSRVAAKGLPEFTVSSDMHARSFPKAVPSLADVMTKVHALGYPLADTVRAVTTLSAARFGLADWLRGWPDGAARATFFRYAPNDGGVALPDSLGSMVTPQRVIIPCGTAVDGRFRPAAV